MKKIGYSLIFGGIALIVICGVLFFARSQKGTGILQKEDPLLRYCCLKGMMDSKQFENFLIHLSDERITNLRCAIGLVKLNESDQKKGKLEKREEVKKWLNWQSKHWATWLVTKNDVDYDEIVRWTAKKLKIKNTEYFSTFQMERKILNAMFEKIWDKMTPQQRQQALKKMKGSTGIKKYCRDFCFVWKCRIGRIIRNSLIFRFCLLHWVIDFPVFCCNSARRHSAFFRIYGSEHNGRGFIRTCGMVYNWNWSNPWSCIHWSGRLSENGTAYYCRSYDQS